MRKLENNPMSEMSAFPAVPCCGAKTRAGGACRLPAMRNGRCRLHGGLNPGAPRGNMNALKHGMTTAAERAWRREVRRLLAEARDVMERV